MKTVVDDVTLDLDTLTSRMSVHRSMDACHWIDVLSYFTRLDEEEPEICTIYNKIPCNLHE